MQEELNGLNKLNKLNGEAFCFRYQLESRSASISKSRSKLGKLSAWMRPSCDRRDADLKSLGSTPHRHRSKFLMNYWGRKDGQFRSGGLLVGDRPFSFVNKPVGRLRDR
jgi:hypothetical protein